jgi:hypothetical protein
MLPLARRSQIHVLVLDGLRRSLARSGRPPMQPGILENEIEDELILLSPLDIVTSRDGQGPAI